MMMRIKILVSPSLETGARLGRHHERVMLLLHLAPRPTVEKALAEFDRAVNRVMAGMAFRGGEHLDKKKGA